MRPVLIIQNDTGNRHSPTVIAAAITSQTGKDVYKRQAVLRVGNPGMAKGGSGDVLAGMLGALLCQMPARDAVRCV